MIDLDFVDVGSKLTITTTNGEIGYRAEFCAGHKADKGYAIQLRVMDDTPVGDSRTMEVAIDRKAAKMIVNYLQTIYEL